VKPAPFTCHRATSTSEALDGAEGTLMTQSCADDLIPTVGWIEGAEAG
jgi:hypothetical protein